MSTRKLKPKLVWLSSLFFPKNAIMQMSKKDLLIASAAVKEVIDVYGNAFSGHVHFDPKQIERFMAILHTVLEAGLHSLTREQIFVCLLGIIDSELESLIGQLVVQTSEEGEN